MANREHPASKTQLRKAEELGIDTSDTPGYTTLGARLESVGWNAKGTERMDEYSAPVASLAIESRGRWNALTTKEKRAIHRASGMRELAQIEGRNQDGETTPYDQSNFGHENMR